MRYDWWVAIRFLREGRFQTGLILFGAAVGIAVIVFLTALLSGLQASLLQKTLGSQAHIVVRPPKAEAQRLLVDTPTTRVLARVQEREQRRRSIEQWQSMLQHLRRLPDVTAAAPLATSDGFAQRGEARQPIAILGVELASFNRIIDVRPRMKAGRAELRGSDALLGTKLAEDLGLQVGDRVRITSAFDVKGTYTVAGIFDFGNQVVNERWFVVSLRNGQFLAGLPGGVTNIDLKVGEIFAADRVATRIHDTTGLVADSWMKTNADLLVGLRSQSSSGQMIGFFVIVAVALGIASVLVVSVVQKSREIGVLRATGTSRRAVQRIFLIQGAVVGLVGAVGGCVLGALLAKFFETLATNPDGSPVFPVNLNLTLFAGASLLSIVTGVIAAYAPARRAAKLDPAEAIRYG